MDFVWIGTGVQQTMRKRAHWLRRVAALLIDQIVVYAALLLLMPFLHLTSGGFIQGIWLLPVGECTTLQSPPAGLTLPTDLRRTELVECRTSIFGLETGHWLSMHIEYGGESSRTSLGLSLSLDESGHIRPALSAASVFFLVFLLWRAIGDSFRRGSIGRRLMGIELATLSSATPKFGTTLARQLLLWLPLMPMWLWSI